MARKITTIRDGKVVEISPKEARKELDDHARKLLGDEIVDQAIKDQGE